jgi:hypothetical protein
MSEPKLINPVTDLHFHADGLAIKRQQFIPQSFLDEIAQEREDSITTPAGDTLYRVARIPVAVIEKWDREGFDYNHAPASEILRKLRIDELDKFITTKKRI